MSSCFCIGPVGACPCITGRAPDFTRSTLEHPPGTLTFTAPGGHPKTLWTTAPSEEILDTIRRLLEKGHKLPDPKDWKAVDDFLRRIEETRDPEE